MSQQQHQEPHTLEQALNTLAAERERELQDEEQVLAARMRWRTLNNAIVAAESLEGEQGETDEEFSRRWAPLWRRIARLVREQFGKDATSGMAIDSDPAFAVAHALFSGAMHSRSDAEWGKSLLTAGQAVARAKRASILRTYLARVREHLFSKVQESLRLDEVSLMDLDRRASEEPATRPLVARERRKCPNPSPEALLSGINNLHLRDAGSPTMSAADVMAIYGIERIGVDRFMKSSKFVARDEHPQPHQLPRAGEHGTKGADGKFVPVARWSVEQVLTAALGWARRLRLPIDQPF